MSKKTQELQEQVMAQIVGALERGVVPWRQSWLSDLPYNPITRRTYRGQNVLILWVTQLQNHYERQLWASYRQWGGAGAHVKRGEKGTPIVFFKMNEYPDKENPGEKYRIPTFRLSYIFNVAQVDGWVMKEPAAQPVTIDERHRRARAVVESHAIEIAAGNPAYWRLEDKITMPPIEGFETADDYYRNLFHEMGHWTGHEKRLNRDTLHRKHGLSDKAMEELTAELTSAFLSARCGLEQGKDDNAASYIAAWIKHLDDKATSLFRAATAAGRAAEFIWPAPVVTEAEPELEEAA